MAGKVKLTPFSKLVIVAALIAAVFFGLKYLQNSTIVNVIAPKKGGATTKGQTGISKKETENVIKVCVVTWGGYAGGQYFNEGFRASKESRYYKEYGILVEFKVIDDFNASRAAWKADEVDLQWITADAFPTEVNSLKEFDPKILFQADWSRGGDAIVVRPGINTVEQLAGKKIAVAFGTPSHTFLLWMLNAANLSNQDVEVIEVPSAIDAATMYKSGKVDAAVVWSPDDEACVQAINGTRVLKSTKEATNIIADVFYAKASYIEKHEQELKSFVEGWMRGAAEINSSAEAKQKAASILSQGLSQDEGFCLKAIDNVRLCTYGDNVNFFGINPQFRGVTGEALYNAMADTYEKIGLVKGMVPAWRLVTYPGVIRALSLTGPENAAEESFKFEQADDTQSKAAAFATKQVTINFEVGSAELNQTAQYIVDKEVANILLAFANVRVRVEGNTDNTGNRQTNISLSKKRAQAVVDHLVQIYKFDPNRFIVVGNGPDKPVGDNATTGGRSKNRRTDIQLLESK
ncbi:MAG: OmpA family protein [Chitinivibrionales bacterium]|nr:OmpA family protein [Chitinivibrionales bacterium]